MTVRTVKLAVDLRASQWLVAARYDTFKHPSARRLFALLVHAPAHAVVALHWFKCTIFIAPRYVDSSRRFTGFAGGVFSDRTGVLTRRCHNGCHTLCAAASRAAFIVGRTVLIVAALQLAARGTRYEIRALTRLGCETRRYRGTVLLRTAIHVDHHAGLVRFADDIATRFVAATLLASSRVHLVAVRADQIAVKMLANLRELPYSFAVGRSGTIQFSLQDDATMVHAIATRIIETLQRFVTAVMLALRGRNS